jgi:hypothetical protein
MNSMINYFYYFFKNVFFISFGRMVEVLMQRQLSKNILGLVLTCLQISYQPGGQVINKYVVSLQGHHSYFSRSNNIHNRER